MSYSALAEECACWVGKATPMKEEEGVVQEEVEGQTVVFRADFSMKGKVEDTLTENLFEMEAEGNETGNLNTNSLKFFLAVCKAEVPEQQHCEPELSPGLGKVDPESTPMKEEQKELLISQDEEQLQELFEPKASIFTRHCVKSECKQEESLGKAILAEYPTLSRLTISEQQSFHGILDDHVTVSAAVEIFGAVEKTVAKYEEENSRLRTLLRISPEITPSQLDALRLSLEFSEKVGSSDQQCCEQEGSPCLGNKNPAIKTEQEEKHLVGVHDTKESIFPLPCVKREWGEADPLQGDIFAKYPTLSRLKISKRLCVISDEPLTVSAALEVFGALEKMLMDYQEENKQLRRLLPFTPEIRLCRIDCLHISLAVPTEEQQHEQQCRPRLRQHDSEPPQIKRELQIIKKKERLQWLFNNKNGPIECLYCRKRYRSKSKLKDHIRISHHGKPCACKYCGKPFKLKGDLSKHLRSHTGEKPYSCVDCGKSFSVTKNLTRHKLIHTGEKPFSCSDCGMNFSLKRNLNRHQLIHTGEKPFKCSDCGKSFRVKETLTDHKRTHTGEKPLSCRDCGITFNHRQTLRRHILTHTVEKLYICSECGKGYKNKRDLTKHVLIHTVAKPFSSGESRKRLIRRPAYTRLVKCHTGEN